MKKIVLTLITGFIIQCSFGQLMQATLKPGTQVNSVIFAMKPDANFNQAFSSIVVVFQVPSTAMPKPTVSIINSTLPLVFPIASWNVVESTTPGFYNYALSVATNNPPSTVIASGVEQNIIEVAFNGGPLGVGEKVRLAHLAEGGPLTQFQFVVTTGLGDATNYRKMFYGTGTTSPANPLADDIAGYNAYQFTETSNAVALPVKFLSFLAIKNGDDARLTWTVENDGDNKMFEIERSYNARDFVKVATVDAARNGRNLNSYELTDARLSNLNNRIIYYRVKQIDNNGDGLYSPIRSVNVDKDGSAITLFPNPAKGVTKLVIDAAEAGKATILIRDMTGKLVKQINTQLFKGMNQQDLNVAAFASGEYNVTVMGTGYSHNIKLTKIN